MTEDADRRALDLFKEATELGAEVIAKFLSGVTGTEITAEDVKVAGARAAAETGDPITGAQGAHAGFGDHISNADADADKSGYND